MKQQCLMALAVWWAMCAAPGQIVRSEEPEYEVGGPLAGQRLPRMPTAHGEEAGYPGCIPKLMEGAETIDDMGHTYRQWGPQGQSPQWHLYDGSVEHWRAYMLKYMPVRSFFDRQSQLANSVAPDIPGAEPAHVEQYAEPVYWVPRHDQPRFTGQYRSPVPVVRMKVAAPVLKLDLGTLPVGLYVVRVIGAVETDKLRPFRQPLFMRMTVNDGLQGELSLYRLRLGYCDEFYSVAEFYFHTSAQRPYRAELGVDHGSAVDLLVYNISLDDVLAGTVRRPIKTRTTGTSAVPVARAARDARVKAGHAVAEPVARDERLTKDAAIWNAFPPLNTQGSTIGVVHGGYGSIQGVTAGSDKWSGEQIVEQFGQWAELRSGQEVKLPEGTNREDVFLFNSKLGLAYTIDDLRHRRPLPAPYPLPDDGSGLYFPDPQDPSKGAVWMPIGWRVHQLHRDYYNRVGAALKRYQQRGQYDDAHDAAITLVRWAYAFPTLDFSEYLDSTVHDPGPFQRDYSCRRRATEANFLPHYPLYVDPVMFWYDELFDFIQDNQLLAESVGRYVPWVKSPRDVIELLDVYLVQTTAKRILRYHYHTDPMDIANLAAVVGDPAVTQPWMEWLFDRTFIYPLPVAGIQDVMISGTTREGTEFVGSTYYAQAEGAMRVAAALDRYLAAGGSKRFDLSDRRLYPKPVAHAYWRLENVVAGADFLRVGDVCGPDKTPGHTLRDLEFARHGWRWTRDPKFAFVMKHYLGRGVQSDEEWSEVEGAASRQPRAPWLDNPSRVLPMWAGVLETGLEHDDYRFRRAAYLRLGYGMGHQHNDSLDLQVVAHGLPMTVDGGQRPGYSVPSDRTASVHNLVQVDDAPTYRHSWATALADHAGARYLAADAEPPAGISHYRRQIALIDVDEGMGSEKLPPGRQRPGAELPKEVTSANSYILDVFRAGGGALHTYCFHGPINDDFQWNAANVAPPRKGSDEAEYLSRFRLMPELNFAGDAPETLEATWRMAVEVEGPGAGEKEMLGNNYLPGAPRKFTRLHLLGTGGARAMRGESVCRQWNYHFTNLMVRKRAPAGPLDSAFVALIEPFAGRPLIEARRELKVDDNEPDSRRAVAVEVRLVDGRADVCLADSRPDRLRVIPDARLKAAAEFAFYSTDAGGLRQATLVGGRTLEAPHVRLTVGAAQRRGRVTRVDYLDKKLWLDQSWPARSTPSVLEIGLPGHVTTVTATSVEPAGGGTLIRLERGGDYFRSRITGVHGGRAEVSTTLRPLVEYIDHNRAGWVASDDGMTAFWRATYLGDGRFSLIGPPVDDQAFGRQPVLRLWEYGVGDHVRQSTSVSLRRVEPDLFELATDTAVNVSLPGLAMEVTAQGKPWTASEVTKSDGWLTIELPARDAPYRVKVKR